MQHTTTNPNPVALSKVSAFITRGDKLKQEILVFKHPTAGVQIPAGTVEANETIEDAVLREIKEEAGLTDVVLHSKLATIKQPLDPDQRMVWQSTDLMTEARDGASKINFPLTRGMTVRIKEFSAPYVQVAYEEYDFRSVEVSLIEKVRGWLPSYILVSHVERHLFHVQTASPTNDEWVIQADRGHKFHFYWVSLSEPPQLVRGQDTWLDLVYDQLKSSF